MPDLYHYGVLGMKWGIRRTPEQLGHKTLKKSKTANLDKWGKDADHNILYVTGLSGSGKGTAIKSFQKPTDQVIHLDNYLERFKSSKSQTAEQNKTFNSYLDKKVPNWKDIYGKKYSKDFQKSSEYWRTVDDFGKAIKSFGKEQYMSGNRVIVEGIQLFETFLYENPSSEVSGKPLIVLSTNLKKSAKQAARRDVKQEGWEAEKEYVKNYLEQSKNAQASLDKLANSANVKSGKKFVEEWLKSIK